MATFQFSDSRYIELDFCGQFQHRLALNGETQRRCKAAGEFLLRKSEELKGGEDAANLDALTDHVMDAIDDILGEGMADRIMELRPDYTFFDALDVFRYIVGEIGGKTSAVLADYSATADGPAVQIPGHTHAVRIPAHTHNVQPNRAGRRAAARAGR